MNPPRIIHGETLVCAAMVRACAEPGGAAKLARSLHISQSMLSQVVNGHARVTPRIAAKLGFELRYVRVGEGVQ